jgi:hypothetical protein
MSDFSNKPREDLSSKPISKPAQAGLPKLRDDVHVVHFPSANSDDTVNLAQGNPTHTMPPLPEPAKVQKFYIQSIPLLLIPTTVSAQAATLNLDSMLALIRPKNDKHATQILSVAINLWRSIDGRAFGASPYDATPFKTLEAKAQTARDLLYQTKTTINTIKANFRTSPQKVLQTFIKSVTHYRGKLAWLSLHEATLLAAYELVYDAGVTPYMPRPEMQRSGGTHAIRSAKPSTLRADNATDAEIQQRIREQGTAEGEAFLYKKQLKEHNNFCDEIRRSETHHTRYGPLITLPPSATSAHRLSDIPDWIKHAIDVAQGHSTDPAGAHPTEAALPLIPPIQSVAM